MIVLVTGAKSQLGLCLKDIYNNNYESFSGTWEFFDHSELDITSVDSIQHVFNIYSPDVVINCAAYTNVEKAEDDFELCHKVNCIAIQNLVDECEKRKIFLIHISTDYVYSSPENIDEKSKYDLSFALKEDAELSPISKYGISKYLGELICKKAKGTMIIRTSWLYSQYGHNFVKTMIGKIKYNDTIKVVNDQIGRPTNANDLARFIFNIIKEHKFNIDNECEIYNFQNSGYPCSWYEFTTAIWQYVNIGTGKSMPIFPVKSSEFPCKAKRPSYSVMDISKASKIFNIDTWYMSLRMFLKDHLFKLMELVP